MAVERATGRTMRVSSGMERTPEPPSSPPPPGPAAASAFEEEDLTRVGGEGEVGFAAAGRGELARGGGLAGELVEGVGVDVGRALLAGDEGEGLAVGGDDGVADRDGDGKDGEALADAFEDDSGGFDLLRGGGCWLRQGAGGCRRFATPPQTMKLFEMGHPE